MTFLERAGGVLFRWRSFTPVPLIAVALPLLWRSRGPASPLWLVSGLLLCVLGQALRAWVLGQVPDGTSGQNERLIATALNTSGPYAHTRNPLYLGNLGITLGLCLVAHAPLLFALVALLFGLQYRAIIAAEESFLRGQFGAEYDGFCARVPRFWPQLRADGGARAAERAGQGAPGAEGQGGPGAAGAAGGAARPWSWRRALKKEHNPLAAWLLLALLFVGLDRLRVHAPVAELVGAFGAVVLAWLGVKAWKHRWLSGGFAADLRRRARETSR
jgi:protein-S-isoprenylcysteine O-methyltransferase Ste14